MHPCIKDVIEKMDIIGTQVQISLRHKLRCHHVTMCHKLRCHHVTMCHKRCCARDVVEKNNVKDVDA